MSRQIVFTEVRCDEISLGDFYVVLQNALKIHDEQSVESSSLPQEEYITPL